MPGPDEELILGPLRLQKIGDLTVEEDLALAQEELAMAQSMEKGRLISQKEFQYRRVLAWAKVRSKFEGSIEDLARSLTRKQAVLLIKFFESEMAEVGDDTSDPVPLEK